MTDRNDPCPCGSGKKYKACCRPSLGRDPRVIQLTWAMQHDIAVPLAGLRIRRRLHKFFPKLATHKVISTGWLPAKMTLIVDGDVKFAKIAGQNQGLKVGETTIEAAFQAGLDIGQSKAQADDGSEAKDSESAEV